MWRSWVAVALWAGALLLPARAQSQDVLCEVSGAEGAQVMCLLRLARGAFEQPHGQAIQLTLSYPPALDLQYFTACEVCPNPIPPAPTVTTGHTVALSPASPSNWAGQGSVILVHFGSDDAPLTDAYFDVSTLNGGAVFLVAHFVLESAIAAGSPVQVLGSNVEVSGPEAIKLKSVVQGNVIVTSPYPITCGVNGLPCNDGDACTVNDTCITGFCVGVPLQCSDGDACNGLETCNPATGCVAGSPPSCNDGDLCNGVESCAPAVGCVPGVPLVCNDLNACNGVETCDPIGGCVPGVALVCNDGNACNGVETCAPASGCTPGVAPVCKDNLVCTEDFCHPALGCQHPLKSCNDGNACTIDACSQATDCTHAPLDCNDNDTCTSEVCNAATGCVYTDLCGIQLKSISPTASEPATVRTFTLTGSLFTAATQVAFEAGTLQSFTFVSASEATVSVLTPPTVGTYDVTVTDAGKSHTLADALAIVVPPSASGTVKILSPASGATYNKGTPATPVEMKADVQNVVLDPAGAKLAWSIDGILSGTTTQTTYVFPDVLLGQHTLTVQLVGAGGVAFGTPGSKALITVKVTAGCGKTSDCDDGNPCSLHACSGGSCKYGPAYAGCCTNDDMCGAGQYCIDGKCTACKNDSSCVDGNACSLDLCVGGACQNPKEAGCCKTNGDCNDGSPCTIDTCDAGNSKCTYQVSGLPNCCTKASDCDDANVCTIDTCIKNECRYGPKAGCCSKDADCKSGVCSQNKCIECSATINPTCEDGIACTIDVCNLATNKCSHVLGAGCCLLASHCNDGNSCTQDICNSATNSCSNVPKLGCCVAAVDCDDNVPCNYDVCVAGKCRHGPNPLFPKCCSSAAVTGPLVCTDKDPCTADTCIDNSCTSAPATDPLCCGSLLDCDDQDQSTLNQCVSGKCTFPKDPTYCVQPSDCTPPNPCYGSLCIANKCQFAPLPDCCVSNTNCNDGEVCTLDTCNPVTHKCVHTPKQGCCHSVADCNDGKACTVDKCLNTTCRWDAIPGCCVAAADCNDSNTCTTDVCTAGKCEYTSAPGCTCLVAADCKDADACTTETCVAGVCKIVKKAGCCLTATDCNDSNACTSDVCIFNKCKHTLVSPSCCSKASDCNDADPCTNDVCVANACQFQEDVSCTEATGTMHTFGAGLAAEGFSTTAAPATAPKWTASGGVAKLLVAPGPAQGWEAWLRGPLVDASAVGTVTLQWRQSLPPGAGTAGDLATVQISANGGASWTSVWTQSAAAGSAQEFVTIDITPTAAGSAAVRVAFVWIGLANSGGANWTVDDVVIGAGTPPAITDDLTLPGSMQAGTNANDTAGVSDGSPPDDVVFFALTAAPPFVGLVPQLPAPPSFTALVLVSPSEEQTGNYTFALWAVDDQNLRARFPVTLSVVP